ncbi:chitin deacetylase [Chytridiales sp. JEL 0842]|nr:chitin deacetylase [Chytridiales sp. JEL 0842]
MESTCSFYPSSPHFNYGLDWNTHFGLSSCADNAFPACLAVQTSANAYAVPIPPVPYPWIQFHQNQSRLFEADYPPPRDIQVNPTQRGYQQGSSNARGVPWGDPANLLTDVYSCGENNWAFTIDDGPFTYTQNLLTILSNNTFSPSTFFVIGSNIVQNSQYEQNLRAIDSAGHQIGLHSFTHRPLTTLKDEEIIADLIWNSLAVYKVIRKIPRYYRPPYGDLDNRVRTLLLPLGFRAAYWNVVTEDTSLNLTAPFNATEPGWNIVNITQRISSVLNAGSMPGLDWMPPGRPYRGFVSLHHELEPHMLEALRQSIGIARGRGYRPVRVSECDSVRTPNGGGAYFGEDEPFARFLRNVVLPIQVEDLMRPPVPTSSPSASPTGTGSNTNNNNNNGSGGGNSGNNGSGGNSTSSNGSNNTALIGGVAGGIAALLLSTGLLLFFNRRKRLASLSSTHDHHHLESGSTTPDTKKPPLVPPTTPVVVASLTPPPPQEQQQDPSKRITIHEALDMALYTLPHESAEVFAASCPTQSGAVEVGIATAAVGAALGVLESRGGGQPLEVLDETAEEEMETSQADGVEEVCGEEPIVLVSEGVGESEVQSEQQESTPAVESNATSSPAVSAEQQQEQASTPAADLNATSTEAVSAEQQQRPSTPVVELNATSTEAVSAEPEQQQRPSTPVVESNVTSTEVVSAEPEQQRSTLPSDPLPIREPTPPPAPVSEPERSSSPNPPPAQETQEP